MYVTNSNAGQKSLAMKLKLNYSIATQKYNFEDKIANFPQGV